MQKPFSHGTHKKMLFFYAVLLTDIREHTPFTVRCRPRSTDLASVLHKPVAERASFFRRHNFPECHLHLLRILAVMHEPDAVAQPDAVRIRHNRRLFEYIAHNQVRTFPSHARELQKCVKSSGTWLWYSSRSMRMQALMSRALLFPRPHGRTISSISSGVAFASASISGYFA